VGRLAGFDYRKVSRKLKRFGFEFCRQAAGSHEIWLCRNTGLYTTIPNHSGDIPEVKGNSETGSISPDEFLKK